MKTSFEKFQERQKKEAAQNTEEKEFRSEKIDSYKAMNTPEEVKKFVGAFKRVVIMFALLFALIAGSILVNSPDIWAPEEKEQKVVIRNNAEKESHYSAAFPSVWQSYTTSEAYRVTNVERVKFNRNKSKMRAEDSQYLGKLFDITDFLVAERVHNYGANYHNKPLRDLRNYDLALNRLYTLEAPERLREFHGLVVEAVQAQRDYYRQLRDTGTKFDRNDPLVKLTHNNLIQAWQILRGNYKKEYKHNKKSFYSHLCALDSI